MSGIAATQPQMIPNCESAFPQFALEPAPGARGALTQRAVHPRGARGARAAQRRAGRSASRERVQFARGRRTKTRRAEIFSRLGGLASPLAVATASAGASSSASCVSSSGAAFSTGDGGSR